MPAVVQERLIRIWASPQGAPKSALAGTMNTWTLGANPGTVIADVPAGAAQSTLTGALSAAATVAGAPPDQDNSVDWVEPASTTTSTSTSTSTTSTSSSTLLACGGVAPACLGSCPPGKTCTGTLLQPCTCQ